MADTVLVKVQTLDHFGRVLQCTDERNKLPTLHDYFEAGWEVVALTHDQTGSALVALKKQT